MTFIKQNNARGRTDRGQRQGRYHQNPSKGVIESHGPAGKVRGNLQQLIDRYTALGKDVQASREKTGAELYFQYAEHYRRLLLSQKQDTPHSRMQDGLQHEAQRQDGQRQEAEPQQPGHPQESQGHSRQEERRSTRQPRTTRPADGTQDTAVVASDTNAQSSAPEPAPKPRRQTHSRRVTRGRSTEPAPTTEETADLPAFLRQPVLPDTVSAEDDHGTNQDVETATLPTQAEDSTPKPKRRPRTPKAADAADDAPAPKKRVAKPKKTTKMPEDSDKD